MKIWTLMGAVVIAASIGLSSYANDTPEGSVFALGRNTRGQLGDGTTENRLEPIEVTGTSDIVVIAAGALHSLALKSDGTVLAWGANNFAQLGDGTREDRYTPVKVLELTDVIAIAAGNVHSLALKSDGTVWAWGYSGGGQLGEGKTYWHRTTPVQVSNITNIIAISAGARYSLAVDEEGKAWAWGYNGGGQLGDGTTEATNVPVQVAGLTEVVAVAAGKTHHRGLVHSLALKSDGTVWAWGGNAVGQLGGGTFSSSFTPTQVLRLDDIVEISVGIGYSLALKSDGTVWGWGVNTRGQLGDVTLKRSNVPVRIPEVAQIDSISAFWNHSLALQDNGNVWGWGDNSYGQLGEDAAEAQHTPVKVSGIKNITSISGGVQFSLAVGPSNHVRTMEIPPEERMHDDEPAELAQN